MAQIPLYKRDEVAGCALVDDQDLEWLSQWKWHVARGYVFRYVLVDSHWKRVWMHRLILGLADDDTRCADHINRRKTDNRRGNLRVVTVAENMQNRARADGVSKYRGVYWDSGSDKWRAQGTVGGKQRALGRFDSEEAAAECARQWREQNMPFACE